MVTIPTSHYFNEGETATDAHMNTMRDNARWALSSSNSQRAPMCMRYTTGAATSIPNNTYTRVNSQWAVLFDTDSMTATAGRITFNTTGLYQISARLVMNATVQDLMTSSASNGVFGLSIARNNAGSVTNVVANTILEDDRFYHHQSTNPFRLAFGFSDFYYASAGEYIEYWVKQNTGAAQNLCGSTGVGDAQGCTWSARMVATG